MLASLQMPPPLSDHPTTLAGMFEKYLEINGLTVVSPDARELIWRTFMSGISYWLFLFHQLPCDTTAAGDPVPEVLAQYALLRQEVENFQQSEIQKYMLACAPLGTRN